MLLPLLTLPTGIALALTFELLPDRITFLSFVLELAGAGGLTGSAIGRTRQLSTQHREGYAERGAFAGALAGIVAFGMGALVQGLS